MQLDGGTSLHGRPNWRPHFLHDLSMLELGIVFEECRRGARSGKGLRNTFVIQIESLAGYVEHIEDLLPPL